MTPAPGPVADPSAPLARRNPVAKAGAALLFTGPLLATTDPFTPAAALAVELLALPFFGIRPGVLARRAAPWLLLAAAGALVTVALFAAGRSLVEPGPAGLTTGVPATAGGLALRFCAVALPGVVVLATTDPTDLADALMQNTRTPARFAIGALAAFRLVPLLDEQRRARALARRARGVDAGHDPVTHLRLLLSTAFALPAGATRHGARLATAMDARGLDPGVPRTHARRQHFTRPDFALLGGAFLTAVTIIAVAVAFGLFQPVVG